MATTLVNPIEQDDIAARRGFAPGSWRSRVNVREFIQRNYTPYEGDSSFLQGATDRTRGIWKTLQPLFAQEREKGILDVSQVPSGILAHAPGYIDKANELIVGLQTEAPLKRAIMPFGGWRGWRRASNPTATSPILCSVRSSPSTARRTMTACSTPIRRTSARHGRRGSSPDCPTPTGAAASSATIAGWHCTAWISWSPTRNASGMSSITAIRPRK